MIKEEIIQKGNIIKSQKARRTKTIMIMCQNQSRQLQNISDHKQDKVVQLFLA